MESENKIYYFTWGTLKKGFANHDKYLDILNNPLGDFHTTDAYALIVPKDSFCPNPGCQFVHRIGALTDSIDHDLVHVTGEVFEVTQKGLVTLDELESYDPDNEETSTYIRKLINVSSRVNGEASSVSSIQAYCYFINDPTQYVELLEADMAESVDTYTQQMGVGPLKACCKRNIDHCGDHDVLPFPTIPATE